MNIDLEKLAFEYVNKEGFIKHNNIKVELIKKNFVKMFIDIDKNMLNMYNVVHGGLLFGIADAAMALAAISNGKDAVTITSEIKYLKPGSGKRIYAVVKPLKICEVTAKYQCDIYNDDDILCATATGNYYFLK